MRVITSVLDGGNSKRLFLIRNGWEWIEIATQRKEDLMLHRWPGLKRRSQMDRSRSLRDGVLGCFQRQKGKTKAAEIASCRFVITI